MRGMICFLRRGRFFYWDEKDVPVGEIRSDSRKSV